VPEPTRTTSLPERPIGDGLSQLGERMERARRVVPPPRRPAESTSPAVSNTATPLEQTQVPVRSELHHKVVADPIPAATNATISLPPTDPGNAVAPLVLNADDAQANLAVRVRRPLDDRLADLLDELRRSGSRSSKAELIEMLLWELPPGLTSDLSERLAHFRVAASRR
jgi:hypothetical protein